MTRRIATIPSSPTLKCSKCGFDLNPETSQKILTALDDKAGTGSVLLGYQCPTPGCGALVLAPGMTTTAPAPAPPPTSPKPAPAPTTAPTPPVISATSTSSAAVADLGSARRMSIGPTKYSPVRYHTFDVGPVEITYWAAEGETPEQVATRAASELDVAFRVAFRTAKQLFIGSFEALYGKGSYERSLGGDAVVTPSSPSAR